MKRALIIILVAALAFCGYWFAGAWTLSRGIGGWLDDRRAEGWVAEYARIGMGGFPTLFRATVEDLTLADPETGVIWAGPLFEVVAETTAPNRIVAIWPGEQTLGSPYDRLQIVSEDMRADIAFVPGTRLELRETSARMRGVTVNSEKEGWSTSLATGSLSAVSVADRPNTYDIGFIAADVIPAAPLRAALDPAGILPEIVEGLRVEARIAFDAPWDRLALERARPQISALDLGDLRASWGELEIRAAGSLAVQDGVPEGRITVRATNWREMLGMARAAGLLPEALAPTVENVLEALARLSGSPDTLDAPLTFRNGRVAFGPIPLGPAPDLTIR